MGEVATLYAIATSGALLVCIVATLLRHEAHQLFGAAAFVFVMFWMTKAIAVKVGLPWSTAHYAAQDLALVGLLAITWGKRHEWWKSVLVVLLVAQLGFHAAYWGAYIMGAAEGAVLWRYILANNVGYALILLVLTIRGGAHVVAGVGDLLRSAGRVRGWSRPHGPRVAG